MVWTFGADEGVNTDNWKETS